MIRSFLQDYRDRRGSTRDGVQLIDVLTALSLALGISVQVVERIHQLLAQLVPLSPPALNLLASAVCALWAAAVVQARTVPGDGAGAARGEPPAYRYGRPARAVAKVLLPLLLLLSASLAFRVAAESRPLPSSIFGYLVDERDRPLAGVRVELVSSRGKPLAAARYETDDDGFYIVRAPRRIPRSARLRVIDSAAGCGRGTLLRLGRENRLRPPSGPPALRPGAVVFRHAVPCPES